jgi:RNase P subunit RPR2
MSTLAKRLHLRLRRTANGCLVWIGALNSQGYGNIYTHTENGKTKTISTHRAAWMLANGPIPEGMDVLHECDNPPCCDENHLFLGTQADNMEDKRLKGRAKPGPVSRKEWWTSEQKANHSEIARARNLAARRQKAIDAGYPPDYKHCPTCNRWLATSMFNANRARFDGLSSLCKACKHTARLTADRIKTGRKQRHTTRSDKVFF